MKIKKDDNYFEKGFQAGAGGLVGILSAIAAINFITWFVAASFIGILFLIGNSMEGAREFRGFSSNRAKVNTCKNYMRRGRSNGYELYENNKELWNVLNFKKNKKMNQTYIYDTCSDIVNRLGRKVTKYTPFKR